MDDKDKRIENDEFLNADDLEVNSLAHYITDDENDQFDEIKEVIDKGAAEVVGSVMGHDNSENIPGQISLFDDVEESQSSSDSGFDKNAFLKSAKSAALGFEKTASINGANTYVSMHSSTGTGNSYTQRPYNYPMLTLSDMKIPKTTTEFFKWCKYYYMFDPLIAGAINASATFPVTDIYFEDSVNNQRKDDNGDSDELKLYQRVLLKKIGLVDLCINIGIDYHLYGNCFVFGEMVQGADGKPEWGNVIRLDPNKILIDFNPVTQEKRYRWQIPEAVAKLCRDKKPVEAYNKIPDIIKRAVHDNKTILLNPKRIYHFSRPTDSGGDNSVWGVPIIAHVLKLITYRNILRQAQEAIAREHIVPMRVYFVNGQQQNYDHTTNWQNVADNLAVHLAKQVRDPNYKVVSPVPLGLLNVGGEGRQLLLTPEIDQIQSEILAGMNIPREFLFGGISYSGTSISLRILENQFITYRLTLLDFINNFLIKGMAEARGEWTSELDDNALISAKMVDMKMVDDVQQKQLIIDLNSRGKVTDEYLWKSMGLDADKIKSGLEQEALDQIHKNEMIQKAQIDSQIAVELYQIQRRKEAGLDQQPPEQGGGQDMQQPEQSGNQDMQTQGEQDLSQMYLEQNAPNDNQTVDENGEDTNGQIPQIDSTDVAESAPTGDANGKVYATAEQLLKLPKYQRNEILANYPVDAQQKLNEIIAVLESQKNSGADMRPMPEQKPPRRAGY